MLRFKFIHFLGLFKHFSS